MDAASYYYMIKPLIPRRLQILVRSWAAVRKRGSCAGSWPIDRSAGAHPDGWQGWPDGKQFALVLTHDVDTVRGQKRCRQLMHLELAQGFRSSFNFVAAGYPDDRDLRHELTGNGFEVGIHGLHHDRRLYASHEEFRKQAVHINRFLQEWQAVGFRSPCMYHNLEWLRGLDILYDASTFDTDPFEPQPEGTGTIFPFCVPGIGATGGYVELPYTMPQDFTLFVLHKEKDIGIWREKLAWIADRGGMALVNTHPDYMYFNRRGNGYEEYEATCYEELLMHVRESYAGRYWHVLPKEMAGYWAHLFSDVTPSARGDK
jgi:peptidoglycan/xylan/chitin deacetylase (PgdA/CDA1 family)